MAIEIELKAHVSDCEAIKLRLHEIACYQHSYTKEDAYWFAQENGAKMQLPASGIRIRKESICDKSGDKKNTMLVTYKTKEVRGNIEVNNEKEFLVCGNAINNNNAGIAEFENLLHLLGLAPKMTKKKEGFLFVRDAISAELSLVEKLGWFIELEIIAEKDDEATVQNARLRLLDFLRQAGISEDKIETRYYTEMIALASSKL
jgi:adenylate cyclase class 2